MSSGSGLGKGFRLHFVDLAGEAGLADDDFARGFCRAALVVVFVIESFLGRPRGFLGRGSLVDCLVGEDDSRLTVDGRPFFFRGLAWAGSTIGSFSVQPCFGGFASGGGRLCVASRFWLSQHRSKSATISSLFLSSLFLMGLKPNKVTALVSSAVV